MDLELAGNDGGNLIADAADDTPAPMALPTLLDLPPARARIGETRKQTWERLRQEARAAGMAKKEAYVYATREVDQVWPAPPPPEPDPPPPEPDPPPPDPPEPEPPPEPTPEPPAAVDTPDTAPAAVASTGDVDGLGDLPEDWPTLPANAALQAEVSWVQANRLRVRRGDGVDLSRSLGPAPSYAALSWLETSILFPAKFADVTVRASTDQPDDTEATRRERLVLAEVRTMLAEMMGGST